MLLHRKEFAIVPGLADDFKYSDGLLLLNEPFCMGLLSDTHRGSDYNRRQLVRMCIGAPTPLWHDPFPEFDLHTLRLNGISLRFFTNCSSLWRFRTLILLPVIECDTLEKELTFVKDLSGFKAFNYHLYNYWLSLIQFPTFPDHSRMYLSALVDQSMKEPSNFSPLHILIVGFTDKLLDLDQFSSAVSRLLDRFPTEALIEFSASLCLSPNVPPIILSKCRSFIPIDSVFIDLLV